jgi:hypothetical protein
VDKHPFAFCQLMRRPQARGSRSGLDPGGTDAGGRLQQLRRRRVSISVMASHHGVLWSGQESDATLSVGRAHWETWGFRGLCGAGFLALLWTLHLLQLRQMQQEFVNALEARVMNDLHRLWAARQAHAPTHLSVESPSRTRGSIEGLVESAWLGAIAPELVFG